MGFGDGPGFVAELREHLGGHGEKIRLVLDEQYPLAVAARRRRRRLAGGGERVLGARQVDGKRAALLEGDADVDCAARVGDDRVYPRQTESGAPAELLGGK